MKFQIFLLSLLMILTCANASVFSMQEGKDFSEHLTQGKTTLTKQESDTALATVLARFTARKPVNLVKLPQDIKVRWYKQAQELSIKKMLLRSYGISSPQDIAKIGDLSDFIIACSENCSALQKTGVGLDLSNLGLTSLEGLNLVDRKAVIVYLSLADNELTSLDRQAFIRFSALEMLDLSNNKLQSLPTGLFEEQSKSLLAVSLRHNQLKTLPEDLIWWPLLTMLELSGNQFGFAELDKIYATIKRQPNRSIMPQGIALPISNTEAVFSDPSVLQPCCAYKVKEVQVTRTVKKEMAWPSKEAHASVQTTRK